MSAAPRSLPITRQGAHPGPVYKAPGPANQDPAPWGPTALTPPGGCLGSGAEEGRGKLR